MGNTSLSISTVASRWDEFIDSINAERMLLGSQFCGSKPLSLKQNELKILLETPDSVSIIKGNPDYMKYLLEKGEAFFGTRISFELTAKGSNGNGEHALNNVDGNLSNDESQLISAIMDQLGAQELSR